MWQSQVTAICVEDEVVNFLSSLLLHGFFSPFLKSHRFESHIINPYFLLSLFVEVIYQSFGTLPQIL